ncbi:MAG TPA: SDR family oxidoreductase [Candidatus Tumulicola sp.]|nr:SDR family oxidoreductase [Candidatus Tumulicola sp.]
MITLGLEGKVIFVTGGSRGIGAALVGLLEDMGCKVAYTYQTAPGQRGALAIKADIASADEMQKAVDRVENELGPIWGAVSNAGITRDNSFLNITPEDWTKVIHTNLTGAYNLTHPLVGKLYERKGGSIVFISSIVGERGNMGQANYAASKAGLVGFAKTLAREGARNNVRVNVITPGFIDTDMLKPVPDKVKEKILMEIPFRRFGKPDEIGWGCAILLSPVASSYITGAVLRINGGHHM